MEEVWGGEECWGTEAPKEDRWRRVLDSGCQEGEEMRKVWAPLYREAQLAATWLGEEVPAVLATPLPGLGAGCVTGETRGKVVEAVENLRAKVLKKALHQVRPKSTRAAWAWKQRDKVSSAWLLATPGHDTTLSKAEFSEAAASNLCLPSPACRGRVGEVIRGQVKVDLHGDNIQATSLPGDHWRSRHNALLQHLASECLWAGVPVQLEVFNLFVGCMQQQGLSRAERGRQYQGIVPDMRITLPGVGGPGGVGAPGLAAGGLAGQSSSVLHELKVISSSGSRYKPTWTDRAVDVRAGKLQKEYNEKAQGADRRQGVLEGRIGPVEEKLASLGKIEGIVAGQFGEVSEATHRLVAALATSRVRVAGPTRGRRGLVRTEEAERSVAVASIRRRLGVMTVRCQASSLLGRLETLGPGGAAAVGRRQQAGALERRWKRETRANQLATEHGWRALRSGFAKTD